MPGKTNSLVRGIASNNDQSRIEKTTQAPEIQELVEALTGPTERAGFEPAVQFINRTTV